MFALSGTFFQNNQAPKHEPQQLHLCFQCYATDKTSNKECSIWTLSPQRKVQTPPMNDYEPGVRWMSDVHEKFLGWSSGVVFWAERQSSQNHYTFISKCNTHQGHQFASEAGNASGTVSVASNEHTQTMESLQRSCRRKRNQNFSHRLREKKRGSLQQHTLPPSQSQVKSKLKENAQQIDIILKIFKE